MKEYFAMNISKGILCTVDFSETSEDTVKWAVSLAKELNCPLTILYTYRLTRKFNEDVVAYKKKMEQQAIEKFKRWELLFLKSSGVPYTLKAEIGFITDRVEDHKRKNAVSFLVMDKKMSTNNRETFNDLVEHVNVPVVIVP